MALKFRANQLPVMLLGEVCFSIGLKCGCIIFLSTFSLKVYNKKRRHNVSESRSMTLRYPQKYVLPPESTLAYSTHSVLTFALLHCVNLDTTFLRYLKCCLAYNI